MNKMAQGRVQRAASKVDFKSLALAERLMTSGLRKKDKRNNSRFYDIELISKEPQVIDGVLKKKVHYVGYSHDFDEWVPVNEIINTSPLILPGVMSDVAIHDLSILRFRIKESLYLKRRMDTKIILNQAISLQTWGVLSPRLKIIKVFPKRATIYTTDEGSLSDLFHDDFWFRRILNEAGDIAQINMNTLQLLCTCKKSIKEYVEKDGKLVFNEIESGLNLKLQYVIEHNKY